MKKQQPWLVSLAFYKAFEQAVKRAHPKANGHVIGNNFVITSIQYPC